MSEVEDVVQHVRDRIEEIESDERLSDEMVDVATNAPLALHQYQQKGRLEELRRVLNVLEADE